MPKHKENEPITVDNVSDIVRRLKPFCGTDDKFPMCKGIHIAARESDTGNYVDFVATNGMIMKIISAKTDVRHFSATIPGTELAHLFSFDQPVTISCAKGEDDVYTYATFRSGDREHKIRLQDGHYPEYQLIWDKVGHDIWATVKRQSMIRSLNRLSVVAPHSGRIGCSVRGSVDLTVKGDNGEGFSILDGKGSYNAEAFSCWFNYQLMQTVLHSIDAEEVTFHTDNTGLSPILVDSGLNEAAFIMPMKAKE